MEVSPAIHLLQPSAELNADGETREVTMLILNNKPIRRRSIDGQEYNLVVSHAKDAQDPPSRPVVLIEDHDSLAKPIGKLTQTYQEGFSTYAKAKLGRSRQATDALSDIQDGIRTAVSAGFWLKDYELQEVEGEIPTLFVSRWELFEVSLLSGGMLFQPAVEEARVLEVRNSQANARSVDDLFSMLFEEKRQAQELKQEGSTQGGAPSSESERGHQGSQGSREPKEVSMNREETQATDAPSEDPVALDRKRTSEILALGAAYNEIDKAREAIDKGTPVDAYRIEVLDRHKPAAPVNQQPARLDSRDLKDYSLSRAIEVLSGDLKGPSLEREVHDHRVSQYGRSPNRRLTGGFYVPFEALTTTSNLPGTISTIARPDLFEESLKNASAIFEAGARVISGLDYNATSAVEGGVTASWTNEGQAASPSAYATTQVNYTPHQLTLNNPFTRRSAYMSNPAVDQRLRTEFIRAIADKSEEAAIRGNGNGIAGIINSANVAVVSGTGTGFDDVQSFIVNLEAVVGAENIPNRGTRAYMTGSHGVASLKTAPLFPGAGFDTVWNRTNNTVNGRPAFETNHLRKVGDEMEVLYGEFDYLTVAYFGPGIELYLKEPDADGTRLLVAWLDVDSKLRRGEAFAYSPNYVHVPFGSDD
jgi:HK97 family phage major capsid protein